MAVSLEANPYLANQLAADGRWTTSGQAIGRHFPVSRAI